MLAACVTTSLIIPSPPPAPSAVKITSKVTDPRAMPKPLINLPTALRPITGATTAGSTSYGTEVSAPVTLTANVPVSFTPSLLP